MEQPSQNDGNQDQRTDPDAVVFHHDLFAQAAEEIARDAWIQSEKAGCDLGEGAKHRWLDQYWARFFRARFFEHLHGTKYWSVFAEKDFGMLKREFQDDQLLLERIVDRLKDGRENLDIINWANTFNLPADRVHAILLRININQCLRVCSLNDVYRKPCS